MRLLILIAAMLVATACASPAGGGNSRPWTDATGVVENAKLGIICSAVAVAPQIVVTASHCLGLGEVPPLTFNGAPAHVLKMGARVAHDHNLTMAVGRNDWALLVIKQKMPWLPLAQAAYQRVMPTMAGGYGRLRKQVSAANCAPYFMTDPEVFVLSCEVRPGDSGGPVVAFDPTPVLVGIVVGTDGTHTMVVPAETFAPYLP